MRGVKQDFRLAAIIETEREKAKSVVSFRIESGEWKYVNQFISGEEVNQFRFPFGAVP